MCHVTVKVRATVDKKGYYMARVSHRVSSISTGCHPLAARGRLLRLSSFTRCRPAVNIPKATAFNFLVQMRRSALNSASSSGL